MRKGSKHKEAAKRKMSLAKLEYHKKHPGAGRKISESLREYYVLHRVSNETREKQSRAMKGRKHSDATRNSMSDAAKERFKDPVAREKMSEAGMGHPVSDAARKNMSRARRNYQKEYPQRWRKQHEVMSIKALKFRGNTQLEQVVGVFLDELGVSYTPQEYLSEINELLHRPHPFDFVLPEHKTVIECDGCYWHCCPTCFPEGHWESDLRIDPKNVRRLGKELENAIDKTDWVLLRFWEHDVDNRAGWVKDRLAQEIKRLEV